MRKSRREKEQEAAEAKKREEEASAAKAYAEFIHAFEGEDASKKKAGSNFVKASTESQVAYTAARNYSDSRPPGEYRKVNRVSRVRLRIVSAILISSQVSVTPDYGCVKTKRQASHGFISRRNQKV